MTGTLLGIVFGLLAGMLHDRFARTRWLWLCLLVPPVSAQVESRTEGRWDWAPSHPIEE